MKPFTATTTATTTTFPAYFSAAFLSLSLLSLPLLSPSVSAESSQQEWRYQTGGPIWSSVKVHDDIGYFGSDDSHFYAIDLKDEALEWRFHTGGKVRSHAAFYEGIVYFSSDDGFLYAVDDASGALRWKQNLNDGGYARVLPANHAPWVFDYGKSSPLIIGDQLFIGSADGKLYAFNAKDGSPLWQFKTKGAIRSTPSADDNNVYIGSKDGHMYAINKDSGKLVWKHASGAAIVSDPAVIDDKIIIGSRDTTIYALDVDDGKVVWQYRFPDESWVESSAMADERGEHFFIGSSDSQKLLKFDVDSGKLVWTFNTRGWSWGTPMVHGDTVYVGAKSTDEYWRIPYRGFYAVGTQSGALEWQYQPARSKSFVTGGVHGQPAFYQEHILIPDLDGSLRVFKLREHSR